MKALAVAAGIVFWTLVLGTAFLAFFPGSDAGEPVAILQIEPATAPRGRMPPERQQGLPPEASESPAAPPPSPPAQAANDGMDLPPGFAVGPPAERRKRPLVEPPGPGQGTPLLPVAPGDNSSGTAFRA